MRLMSLIAMAIKYMKNKALDTINETITTKLGNDVVLYVVTIPAIWNDEAKHFMREASIEVSVICISILIKRCIPEPDPPVEYHLLGKSTCTQQ